MYNRHKQIKQFYTWLQNEGKEASSTAKMKAFFEEMDIDLAQKKHDSLFIQHHVGLGLRALLLEHYSQEAQDRTSTSPGNLLNLGILNTQEVNGTQTRYAFLDDAMIVSTAELFGIDVNVATNDSKITTVLSQEIIHTGTDNNAHFNLTNHDTAANGNCALNALAQSFAVELGMTLIPSPLDKRADYIAGTFTPNNNLEALKSLLGEGSSDLKSIIMDELKINSDPSDANLRDFLDLQTQQYLSITTPFKNAAGANAEAPSLDQG